MRITERWLQQVKPSGRLDFGISGRRGLLLRVSPIVGRARPRITFRFRWFDSSGQHVIALGDYGGQLTLADAHALHAACGAAAKRGTQPKDVVAAYWARHAPPAQPAAEGTTVKQVVDEFLAATKRKRPEQARYLLEANVLPKLGDRPVATLTKRDFVEVFDRILERGSTVLANRTQAVLKQAFAVAADRDLIQSVPIFPRAQPGGEESARTRVLTEDEIGKLWHGLDKLSRGKKPKVRPQLALALKLLLVTAQRRGEVAAAQFDDIADNTWTIPVSYKRKSKANVPHHVPLSPLAQSLIAELGALAKKSKHWLPSERTKKVAVDRARSISKAARDARDALKMKDWRPHDLRRTARTFMAKLGVAEEVAERVLNHGSEDPMVATYNQHPYRAEMRTALEKWAGELDQIIAKAAK